MRYQSSLEKEKLSTRALKHGEHNCHRRRLKRLRDKAKAQSPRKEKKSRDAIVISAPKALSFSPENYKETVKFLYNLKKYTQGEWRNKRVMINLVPIRDMSVAATLVLAAEVDRWRKKMRISLGPVDVDKWDPKIGRMLVEIGFFELLGIKPPNLFDRSNSESSVTTLKLTTGNTLNKESIGQVEDRLQEIANIAR